MALGLAGPASSASPDRVLGTRGPALTPVSLAFPTPDDGWVLAGRGGGRSGAELLATRDPESCAMHGCGLDDAWSSGDGGRHWRAVEFTSR